MTIESIQVGMLNTNCYILGIDNEVLVIDPGYNFEGIKKIIGNRVVAGIIITHYHFDHIGALDELKEYSSAKVYDYSNLNEGINKIGLFGFECIPTPGHKEDLISIYFKKENVLFCGDFIFEGTIGRCDLDGGNFEEMKKSIKKILTYPLDMTIYPGHGELTTLGREKDSLEYWLIN